MENAPCSDASETPDPRELFNRAMRFQCPGQTLATLGGIWPSTLARWHDEGMPRDWTNVPLTEALFRDFVPDAVCIWEDMAYRTGSLLGVHHVREFMLPRYRQMTAHLRRLGVPIILLDSDGCIDQLIPIWLEAGMDGVVPMEAQAGMDVALYREKYPCLLMMGGVDKKALAAGPAAIDREIDKIRRTIATGGLVPFFDHGLPHDASYANFLYYVHQLKQVCGLRT